MNMKHSLHSNHLATVTLSSGVDAFTAPDFQRQMDQLLESGITQLILDLSQVTAFDSAALSVVVKTVQRVRRMGGNLRLVWPRSAAAQRIFKLTKFERVAEMMPTLEAARKATGVELAQAGS